MTGSGLKSALTSLGWSQAKLARRLSVRPNSVARWIAKKNETIPGPVAAYVGLAVKVKELAAEVLDA